jgi:hypothetical protein
MSYLLVLSFHYDGPETGLWKPSQAKVREEMLQHLCVLKLPCVKKQIHVKYASASIHLELDCIFWLVKPSSRYEIYYNQ